MKKLLIFILAMICLDVEASDNNPGDNESIAIDSENFPSYAFRDLLLNRYDSNHDGLLSSSEFSAVKQFDLHQRKIDNLKGIEYFTEVTKLACQDNYLVQLDVSKNTKLETLNCYRNQLTTLTVSDNPAISNLQCYNNKITSLDVSSCTALQNLYCYGNNINADEMQKLINSLPTVTNGNFRPVYIPSEETNAIITNEQVKTAKAKGWTTYYFDKDSNTWKEYEGNTAGVQLLENRKNPSDIVLYNLKGQRVDNNIKGIVIYKGKKLLRK